MTTVRRSNPAGHTAEPLLSLRALVILAVAAFAAIGAAVPAGLVVAGLGASIAIATVTAIAAGLAAGTGVAATLNQLVSKT